KSANPPNATVRKADVRPNIHTSAKIEFPHTAWKSQDSRCPLELRKGHTLSLRIGFHRSMTQHFLWVILYSGSHRSRGSPFQMPTRLAGGLGIGSCRGRSHVRPYAPASNDFEALVPPR